ncbi:hypothetical protein BJV77DRAFT_557612 [Russula vinacea]|nr:hypothetical protein BJV77DRAFT_557612 [Russula vinacea]
MQKVFLALFSVVALLGLVPSFASAETNGNRLARGLPPLPPSRRDTAKYGTPSHVHHHHHGEDHGEGHGEGHGQAPSRRDTAKYGTPSHVHHHHHGEDHGEGHGEGHGQAPSGRRTAKRGIPSHVHHHHGQHHGQDHGQSLAPSGRRTAKRGTPSQVYHHHGQNSDHIQIRDTDGISLGYLMDFTGSGRDLSVVYRAGSHSLSFHGQGNDAHFLGAALSNDNLGPGSPAYVTLTNVALNDNQANAHIWTLAKDGQLIATWPNHDGTTSDVHLCLNAAGDGIILAGDPSKLPSGWKEVQFYLTK